MNERIKELAHKAEFINKRHNGDEWRWGYIDPELADKLEKFAELLIAKVLDEVAERAYCSGDRAWSDELDRPWVELEFGIGELAELKK